VEGVSKPTTHDRCIAVCPEWQRVYIKRGGWTELTDLPDCSCGCKWFHPLEGKEGADWGVCLNDESARGGFLTFEHMGCGKFESE